MRTFKRFSLVLALMLAAAAYSYGQDIYVGVRPERPHYEHPMAPSARHVWIDEDWDLQGGRYVFAGGHWVLPPRPGVVWVPGHWKHMPRGWVWARGHWR